MSLPKNAVPPRMSTFMPNQYTKLTGRNELAQLFELRAEAFPFDHLGVQIRLQSGKAGKVAGRGGGFLFVAQALDALFEHRDLLLQRLRLVLDPLALLIRKA